MIRTLRISHPAFFGTRLEDEGIKAAQHRWWLQTLTHGPQG